MTAGRNPRTGRPDDLVGKRVKVRYHIVVEGVAIEAGMEGRVEAHKKGWFTLEIGDSRLRCRRSDFVVLS